MLVHVSPGLAEMFGHTGQDVSTKLAYTSSTSWTNVKVKAKVPSLSKGKTTITVTTRGGTSNSYTFTVK